MVWLYATVKTFEDMFSRYDTILACDGQTDGQTDMVRGMRSIALAKRACSAV